MGVVQQDAVKTSVLSFLGIGLGYLNKAVLFILLFSTEQVGLLNLLMTVALLFAQFANLGTIYTTWRFFPFFRNPAKQHYGFLFANFLLVTIGTLIVSGLLYVLKNTVVELYSERSPEFVNHVFLIIPLGFSLVLFQLFENYLRGMGKNILPVFLQEIVLRILTTVLLISYGLKLLSFATFVGSYIAIHFIPGIYLLLFLLRKKELVFSLKSIQIPSKFRRLILTYSGYSYLNSLANLLVISMDVLMIAQLIGMDATGVYTTILFMISALIFPYRSIMRVATPIVAKQWKDRDLTGMRALYQKSSSVGLLLSLCGFLAIWIVIDPLLTFVPAYQSGKWVFLFLMLGRIVDLYFGLNGVIFSTSKKYKIDLFFTMFLVLTVYIMNLWLIPAYGINGAAVSTSFVYLLYNLLRGAYIYYHYHLHPFRKEQLRLFLLGLVILSAFTLLDRYTHLWVGMQPIFQIFVKEVLLLIVFIFPIFKWNLEPETVSYIHKAWNKWRKKH